MMYRAIVKDASQYKGTWVRFRVRVGLSARFGVRVIARVKIRVKLG